MNTKGFILSIVFSAIAIFSFSQSETSFYFEYEYDEAGNRISRIVIEMPKLRDSTNLQNDITPELLAENQHPDIFSEKFPDEQDKNTLDKYETNIADHKISVYPNPVEDILIINIYDLKGYTGAELQLICMSGKIIYYENINDNYNIMDFGNIPAGTYILRILIDRAVKEFKIIRN